LVTFNAAITSKIPSGVPGCESKIPISCPELKAYSTNVSANTQAVFINDSGLQVLIERGDAEAALRLALYFHQYANIGFDSGGTSLQDVAAAIVCKKAAFDGRSIPSDFAENSSVGMAG
jgi:hypothetical protein